MNAALGTIASFCFVSIVGIFALASPSKREVQAAVGTVVVGGIAVVFTLTHLGGSSETAGETGR